MIIRPPAIEADSQLQKRLCRRGLRASVAHRVHLEGYFALGLKILSSDYSKSEGFERIEGISRVTRRVDAECCTTVFFQDHA
jgi:hypothetical protein